MLRWVLGSSAVQHACLNKQASIIQSPDDSIHRAPAQCKAEGVACSPVHADCILRACKDANGASAAEDRIDWPSDSLPQMGNLYVSGLHAV